MGPESDEPVDDEVADHRHRRSTDHLPSLIDSIAIVADLVASLTALRTELVADRERWRRERRWPIVLAAVSLAVAALVGLESYERRQDFCAGREVLRAVVVDATAGTGVDFAAVPGFADLDRATQAYLTNLSASGDDETVTDRLLDLAPAC